jgi:AbrB family looped-hinge helix DNA binding protein
MASARLNGMELWIDRRGRVVLPKKLRERLEVGVSLKVEVIETAEGVLLKPVRRDSGLAMEDGVLIFRGGPEGAVPVNWRKLIEEDREERIQHILSRIEQRPHFEKLQ